MRYIGKINKEIFKCISNNITTEDVVITDERIAHINERHKGDFEVIEPFLEAALSSPDYIIADKPKTGLILKRIDTVDVRMKLVLRVHTSDDDPLYKNSVISGWVISESRWENYIKNKKILYKSE